jgi:hypothetical protein
MSQEFSVVFAGPIVDLGHVLGMMSTHLQPLGFRHKPSVTRLEPDESSDSGNAEEVTLSCDAADWNGCSTSFSSTDFTLDVVVSRWCSAFLNVSIDENAQTVRRSYRDGTLRLYFMALVEIARACDADGGGGGVRVRPCSDQPKGNCQRDHK